MPPARRGVERDQQRLAIAQRQQRVLEMTAVAIPNTVIAAELGVSTALVKKDRITALARITEEPAQIVKAEHINRAQWAYRQAVRLIAMNDPHESPAAFSAGVTQTLKALQWLARLEGVQAAVEIKVQFEDYLDARIRQLEEELADGDTGTRVIREDSADIRARTARRAAESVETDDSRGEAGGLLG